jgi:single-stranded-DNA-specific exonuclease
MNALGRLSNANPIVDFLTTEDRSQARVLANRLEGLNDERRLLTNQVYQAAAAQLERDPGLGEMDALVLAHPGWPGGILGLVASRLVEHYQRPVVMLSIGEDGIARGSARSVQGCNITEAIAAQADLLLGFGGHPMAAGLSLPESQVPDFRHRFAAVVADMLAGQDAVQELVVDAVLELPEVSLKLVDDLSRLAPFGAGNPSLTFVSRGLTIRQQQVIGRDQEHRRLVVADEKENIQEVLWWRSAAESLPAGPFDLAYTLQAADFRGERQLQITWVDARPTEGSTAEIRSEKPLQIIDYRSAAHPLAVLDTITDAPRMIWAEAGAAVPEAADRYHLSPAPVLVIWTVPPGDQALRRALETVQPEKVFLLGEDPPYAARRAFLKRLGQLVNYALRVYAGKLEIPRLAAATGHREAVVRVGLNWLAGRGHIKLDWESSSVARAGPGDGEEAAPLGTLSADLERLLAETRAFRSFYLQSDPERLLSSG